MNRDAEELVTRKEFQWKSYDPTSQADTYIEWCFEQKCLGIGDGTELLDEWRIRKTKYKAVGQGIVYDFQHYSRHDETHSINILKAIEMVLGRRRVWKLSTSDLWLLLECAYYHDLAMALSSKQIRDLWTKDKDFSVFLRSVRYDYNIDLKEASDYYSQISNLLKNNDQMKGLHGQKKIEFCEDWPVDVQRYMMILTAEYVRRDHAKNCKEERLAKLLETDDSSLGTSVIKRRYNLLIQDVSMLHGEDFSKIEESVPYKTYAFDVEYMHPQFAAAMLRIGDLLDMDNNRFNLRAINHFGELPKVSRSHYYKHEAITHFVIDEHTIEAKAYSEYEEVCQATSAWFQLLEREVENLICEWNRFAPELLRGCKLNRCNLKVYMGQTLFDMENQKRFEVDKDRLIDMVVGSNIYTSGMDCFREYIQNALDASKVKFWIDRKNSGELRTRMYKDYTPFDFESKLYDDLAVEIHADVKLKENCVRISILDHGIGMEQECVDSLSVVGSGWNRRPLYKNETFHMPEWLIPTGGFGIGLQSVFMLADEVDILSRSAQEIKGHHIKLVSPHKKGYATQHEIDRYAVGTEISFEVNLVKLYSLIDGEENLVLGKHKELNLVFPKRMQDPFDQSENEKFLLQFLKYYVTKTFPDSLFPFKISCGSRAPIWVTSSFALNGKFGKEDNMEKWDERYLYHMDSDFTLRIWDRKESTFAYIASWPGKMLTTNVTRTSQAKTAKTRINLFCYKNVRTDELSISEKESAYFESMAVCIDFMGLDMKEVLSVNRDSFLRGFSVRRYYYEFICLGLKMLLTETKIRGVSEAEKYINIFQYILAAIQLLDPVHIREILGMYKDNINNPKNIQIRRIQDTRIIRDQEDTASAFERLAEAFQTDQNSETHIQNTALFVRAQEQIPEEMIRVISLTDMKKGLQPRNLLQNKIIADQLWESTVIYDNPEICKALLQRGVKLPKYYFRIMEDKVIDNQKPVYIMIDKWNENPDYKEREELDSDQFYNHVFMASQGRYIADNREITSQKYNQLSVKSLPAQWEKDDIGEDKRKSVYIISPIGTRDFRKILMDIEVDESELRLPQEKIVMQRRVSEEELTKIVVKEASYHYLLSWVVENQAAEEPDLLKKEEVGLSVK